MRDEYDFSHAKRAKDIPALARLQKNNQSKERISIRLDADVLAWFRNRTCGGGNYQTLINHVLREHIGDREGALERVLRRVIREELHPPASKHSP